MRNLKMMPDYYNRMQRTAGDFFADVSEKGSRCDPFRPQRLGRHAHDADRHRGRSGVHAADQRQGTEAELDRNFQARRTRAAAVHQLVGDDVFRHPDSGLKDDGGQRGRQQCPPGHGR